MSLRVRCLAAWWIITLLSSAHLPAAAAPIQLLEAVRNGDPEAVRTLLQTDVDVNARAGDGATALHWAVLREDANTADLLIRAGADVNAANGLGVTPLVLACENGSAALVTALLEESADPNTATSMGETALMACARGGDVDAVAALLDRGAALDAGESSRGQTALMWAAAHRHPDVVRVLIAHGADVHARSRVSHLLVPTNAYASGVSHRDTVEMPMGGFTPLLFAARHGDVDSAQLLLDAGAHVNETA
ncbi:MAG: ankyrin repeat domain-containing protein, partial [Vicinamibacterales bacterium]